MSAGRSIAIGLIVLGLVFVATSKRIGTQATTVSPGRAAPSVPGAMPVTVKPPPVGKAATRGTDPVQIAEKTAARIRASANAPDAIFQNVALLGDRQQFACGEMSRSGSKRYVRFVWLAEANVVADSSSATFAQFAPLCDGGGMPEPRAAKALR